MISDVLKSKIEEYAPTNALEQENVLQEIMQHYVLASLSRAGIFSEIIFHGGTCLRHWNRDLPISLMHSCAVAIPRGGTGMILSGMFPERFSQITLCSEMLFFSRGHGLEKE